MNFREKGQEHHRIVRRSAMYEYKDGASRRVGIYFQSFQANLEGQFEFLLRRWANFRSHPELRCGVDPLVGVDPTSHPQQWPKLQQQNAPGTIPQPVGVSISGLTTIRGGEYFYFPSVPFLHNIGDRVKKELEAARVAKGLEAAKLAKELEAAKLELQRVEKELEAAKSAKELEAAKLKLQRVEKELEAARLAKGLAVAKLEATTLAVAKLEVEKLEAPKLAAKELEAAKLEAKRVAKELEKEIRAVARLPR
jgi:hypothetical protein